jgi:hypothetical protein
MGGEERGKSQRSQVQEAVWAFRHTRWNQVADGHQGPARPERQQRIGDKRNDSDRSVLVHFIHCVRSGVSHVLMARHRERCIRIGVRELSFRRERCVLIVVRPLVVEIAHVRDHFPMAAMGRLQQAPELARELRTCMRMGGQYSRGRLRHDDVDIALAERRYTIRSHHTARVRR